MDGAFVCPDPSFLHNNQGGQKPDRHRVRNGLAIRCSTRPNATRAKPKLFVSASLKVSSEVPDRGPAGTSRTPLLCTSPETPSRPLLGAN
jgi:hypothetical protein